MLAGVQKRVDLSLIGRVAIVPLNTDHANIKMNSYEVVGYFPHH